MNEAGDAKSGTWPQHDARRTLFRLAFADFFHVLDAERHNRQRLCLEIVEYDDVGQSEASEHCLRPHHPGAVGQFDLVAIYRAGNRNHRRVRPVFDAIKNCVNGVVNVWE